MEILTRVRPAVGLPQIVAPRGHGLVLAMTKENGEAAARDFQFVRAWRCRCGANLRIRARQDRKDGSSNFIAYPMTHENPRLRGASMLPSQYLTWNGLVEERGWKVIEDGESVECPACQLGLTVREYKEAKRIAALKTELHRLQGLRL